MLFNYAISTKQERRITMRIKQERIPMWAVMICLKVLFWNSLGQN